MAESKKADRVSISNLLNDESSKDQKDQSVQSGTESRNPTQMMSPDATQPLTKSCSSSGSENPRANSILTKSTSIREEKASQALSSTNNLDLIHALDPENMTKAERAELKKRLDICHAADVRDAEKSESKIQTDVKHKKASEKMRTDERSLWQIVEACLIAARWQNYDLLSKQNRGAAKRSASKEDSAWTVFYITKLFFELTNILHEKGALDSITDELLTRFKNHEEEMYVDALAALPRKDYLDMKTAHLRKEDLSELLPISVPESAIMRIWAAEPECPKFVAKIQ